MKLEQTRMGFQYFPSFSEIDKYSQVLLGNFPALCKRLTQARHS